MQAVAAPQTEYDPPIARAVAFLAKHGSTLTAEQKADVDALIARLEAAHQTVDNAAPTPHLAAVSATADRLVSALDQKASVLGATYAWLVALGGLTWAAFLLLGSRGTLLDDEIGHVIFARDAWGDPALILNEWGRTANTLVFMPSAPFGFTAARFFALALSGLTVLLTVRLGRRLGVQLPWAIPLLLFFQPWFAQTSFQALTEIPFMLFVVAGWGLLLEGHLVLAGLAIGLLPLTRHEGILLLALWVAVSAWRRQWSGVVGALIPLVVYNLVSYVTTGVLPAAIYFTPKPTDMYGSGGWLHYALPLLAGVGKPVAVLAALGLPATLRSPRTRLLLAWSVIYVLMHVVIFRFGLFASGGYVVFLLPIAPVVAIMATHGLATLLSLVRAARLDPLLARAATALTVVAVSVVVLRTGSVAAPIPRDTLYQSMDDAASWLRQEGLDHEPLAARHVWLFNLLSIRIDAPRPPVESLPVGTVLVWDSKYSDDGGWTMTYLADPHHGWQSLQQFGGGAVAIFRKNG
jgi:hypothetical protein